MSVPVYIFTTIYSIFITEQFIPKRLKFFDAKVPKAPFSMETVRAWVRT
jgi:hypothetical protein